MSRYSNRFISAIMALIIAAALMGCSSSRYFNVEKTEPNQSVRIFMKTGEAKEGIVLEQTGTELVFVDSQTHEPESIPHSAIRQIELSNSNFDYDGYPISDAEISKYKKSRNTWGYALGGAAVGAGIGLAIATPIWLANDNPPPLFGAGIGLIIGSIYFGSRGMKKDYHVAVEQVREMRGAESQLVQEKAAEEAKLKDLEKEKQELLKKLEQKKSREDADN